MLNGHVEGRRPTSNPLASWWSQAGIHLLQQSNLHDLGTADSLINGSGPLGNP
jgi:hypothetical protein